MAGPSAVRSMRAPRSIASDRQKVPNVELGVHELHPSTQIAQLLEGRIQIGTEVVFRRDSEHPAVSKFLETVREDLA